MKIPGIIWRENIKDDVQCEVRPGCWVAGRPELYYSLTQRWKAAWLVFTGRADALRWDCQPDPSPRRVRYEREAKTLRESIEGQSP